MSGRKRKITLARLRVAAPKDWDVTEHHTLKDWELSAFRKADPMPKDHPGWRCVYVWQGDRQTAREMVLAALRAMRAGKP